MFFWPHIAYATHQNPYPPGPPPGGGRDPEQRVREMFDTLWVPILGTVGLGIVVLFALVPSLRDPALTAIAGGILTTLGVGGLSRRGK